jgi:hypothetical protein
VKYCKEVCGWVGQSGASHVQTLFLNISAIFQDDSAPIHTAGTVQAWFEEHEDELQHRPWPAQSPDLNIIQQL